MSGAQPGGGSTAQRLATTIAVLMIGGLVLLLREPGPHDQGNVAGTPAHPPRAPDAVELTLVARQRLPGADVPIGRIAVAHPGLQGRGEIRGRVVLPAGFTGEAPVRVVVGAADPGWRRSDVDAWLAFSSVTRPVLPPSAFAEVAADGSFRVPAPTPGWRLELSVDCAHLTPTVAWVEGAKGREAEPVTLGPELAGAARLVLQCDDPLALPAAARQLQLWRDGETWVLADRAEPGVYQLIGAPPGTYLASRGQDPFGRRLRRSGPLDDSFAPCHVPDTFRFELAAGRTIEVEVPLVPGTPLRCLVLDQDGEPVAGAEVTVRCLSPLPQGGPIPAPEPERTRVLVTDGEGLAASAGLPPTIAAVQVEAPGYLAARATQEDLEDHLRSPRKPLVIRLDRGAVVRGRLVGPDGAPLEGVRVGLAGQRSDLSTVSGAGGEFTLGGLEERSYRLRADHWPGVGPSRVPGVRPIGPRHLVLDLGQRARRSAEVVVVSMRPGACPSGRVVGGPADAPIVLSLDAAPLTSIERLRAGDPLPVGASITKHYQVTDPQGRFQLPELGPGYFTVGAGIVEGAMIEIRTEVEGVSQADTEPLVLDLGG